MKTLLFTLLLTGLAGSTLMAHPPRSTKSAKARVASTGKPLPPVRINRIR